MFVAASLFSWVYILALSPSPVFYQFLLPLEEYLLDFIYSFCVFAEGDCQALQSAKLLVPEVSKHLLKWEAFSFIFFFFFAKKRSLAVSCRGLELAALSRIWPSVMFLCKMEPKTVR